MSLLPGRMMFMRCLACLGGRNKYLTSGKLIGRLYSTQGIDLPKDGRMRNWQISQYGSNDELILSESTRIPTLTDPEDVLVEVHAASVNPLDIAMRGGYGSQVMNMRRRQHHVWSGGEEFPLTLGRDFSGVVVDVGKKVKHLKPGDEVWGALDVYRQGTHAQYTVGSQKEIAPKPKSIDHVHAASMPYVAVTAVTAIKKVAGMTEEKASDSRKKALVLGGSGGVGSFAIQYLKAIGMEVATTCSTSAVDLVTGLGADYIIDYKTQDTLTHLRGIQGFDLALDTTGDAHAREIAIQVLKPWQNSVFVSIVTPLLRNVDAHGPLVGLASSGLDLSKDIMDGFKSGVHVRWAFFTPNGGTLKTIADMVDANKIQPVVENVYPFEHIPDAYKRLEAKHARGKTVVEVHPARIR